MYLMESATEGDRLEQKTNAEDVSRQLHWVGLQAGMRALDAGAGTGAVARLMADIVGPSGTVTAFDASEARLQQGEAIARAAGITQLSFRAGNLLDPPFEPGSFDFIWCRFVFEYLSDENCRRAMERLTELLAPGGTLVVGDLDGHLLFHDGLDAQTENELHTLIASQKEAFDPYAGRKLYGRFYRQGLQDIQVHCMPYNLYAGRIPDDQFDNWRAKFATFREHGSKILGSQQRYDQFSARMLAFLQSEAGLTYSTLFLVSARKAA